MGHIFGGGAFSAPPGTACRLAGPIPAALQGATRIGISVREMEDWWKTHYGEWERATGGPPPSKPPALPSPPPPPATILGMSSGTVLVGGALLLGAGVVIAIVASRR